MSIADALNSGHLVELLPEYAMTYEPLYLYYPSRRGHSNVFKLIVDALKVKAETFAKFLSPSNRNPNTGFRLFSPPITPGFTQMSP